MDSGNPHSLATIGASRSERTTSGRFRVDLTLTSKERSYNGVNYRYPNTEDQVFRLGQRAGRSRRLPRPNNTPEPGSLATIWLDYPRRSPTQRHTPLGERWHK
jgi:hypothetical protein